MNLNPITPNHKHAIYIALVVSLASFGAAIAALGAAVAALAR